MPGETHLSSSRLAHFAREIQTHTPLSTLHPTIEHRHRRAGRAAEGLHGCHAARSRGDVAIASRHRPYRRRCKTHIISRLVGPRRPPPPPAAASWTSAHLLRHHVAATTTTPTAAGLCADVTSQKFPLTAPLGDPSCSARGVEIVKGAKPEQSVRAGVAIAGSAKP